VQKIISQEIVSLKVKTAQFGVDSTSQFKGSSPGLTKNQLRWNMHLISAHTT